jgi:hypothetical protein
MQCATAECKEEAVKGSNHCPIHRTRRRGSSQGGYRTMSRAAGGVGESKLVIVRDKDRRDTL